MGFFSNLFGASSASTQRRHMRVLVFHEGASSPANVRGYCKNVAEAQLGLTVDVADAQLVATRPGKNLGVAEAMGVYQRMVELGRITSFGSTTDARSEPGPDGAHVVALFFA
jgi:hypothetical protein